VRKVALIDVLRGGVEFRYRLGHASSQAHSDQQRDQLDNCQENCDGQQHLDENTGLGAQRAEEYVVEHRGP
jgi:hypothetical protein